MRVPYPRLGGLLAAGLACGLAVQALGQAAVPELPYATWEMTVAGPKDKAAVQLRLFLSREGKGRVSARAESKPEHTAAFEFRVEQRAKQPILVIRKCTWVTKGAETIVPYRREGDRLRIMHGKIDCPLGTLDLKGEWKRVEEEK